jgi:hypothetical protein
VKPGGLVSQSTEKEKFSETENEYWRECTEPKKELVKHGVDEKHIKVYLTTYRLGICRKHIGLPKNIRVLYISIQSYVHTYVSCTHTHTHTNTQTSTHTHTHMHTCTCPLVLSISLQTVVVNICTPCCNIKKFRMLFVHCICDYHNKQQLLLYTALTDLSFCFCEIPLHTAELLWTQ